jgi:hypothetical protein
MAKAWSKDMVLDSGTFGGTRACHVLVDMMNNNVISVFEKHRVLSFIQNAIHHFNNVATIEDLGVRNYTMSLIKRDFLNRINDMPYPPKFNSFLRNVVCHHSRRALEGVI